MARQELLMDVASSPLMLSRFELDCEVSCFCDPTGDPPQAADNSSAAASLAAPLPVVRIPLPTSATPEEIQARWKRASSGPTVCCSGQCCLRAPLAESRPYPLRTRMRDLRTRLLDMGSLRPPGFAMSAALPPSPDEPSAAPGRPQRRCRGVDDHISLLRGCGGGVIREAIERASPFEGGTRRVLSTEPPNAEATEGAFSHLVTPAEQ